LSALENHSVHKSIKGRETDGRDYKYSRQGRGKEGVLRVPLLSDQKKKKCVSDGGKRKKGHHHQSKGSVDGASAIVKVGRKKTAEKRKKAWHTPGKESAAEL